MDHRTRPVLGQQARYQGAIPDVALHEHMASIPLQAGQGFQIAGVGELVQVEDGLIVACQPVKHEVGADEAGATSDQNHGVSLEVWAVGCRFRRPAHRIIFGLPGCPAGAAAESVTV
ncbi:hypothetical protein FQZ97_1245240 [compost metagenome]